MSCYSELPAITDQDAAPYLDAKCRCGCGQPAKYLTLCQGIGESEATLEACCYSAYAYLSEACAEMDRPFRSRLLR